MRKNNNDETVRLVAEKEREMKKCQPVVGKPENSDKREKCECVWLGCAGMRLCAGVCMRVRERESEREIETRRSEA